MKPARLYLAVFLIISLVAAFSVAMSGCASSGSGDSGYMPAATTAAGSYDRDAPSKDGGSGTSDTGGGQTDSTNIRKLIKNASVAIETDKIDDTFTAIGNWVGENGGYEFKRNINTDGTIKNINVVYKLPPEKLNPFLEFLGQAGMVVNQYVSSDDITAQYYDVKVRLDNLIKGRDQLLKIQEKTVTIEEILQVQAELRDVTGQIESLEGSIKLWDRLVAESTVSINIIEATDPLKSSREITFRFTSFADVWKTMKNGFIIVTNTLFSIVTWLFIAAVSVAPLGVIALAVVLIVRYFKRKGKNRRPPSSRTPVASGKPEASGTPVASGKAEAPGTPVTSGKPETPGT